MIVFIICNKNIHFLYLNWIDWASGKMAIQIKKGLKNWNSRVFFVYP